MTEFEKLVADIMTEYIKEGEPITKEEAEEVAKMEINAKEIKRYEQSDKTKKECKPRERKTDEDKMTLCTRIFDTLDGFVKQINVKSESEINFTFNNAEYTVKLIKHRKK